LLPNNVSNAWKKHFPLQLVWDSENPDYKDERYSPEVWQRLKQDFAVKKGSVAPSTPEPEVNRLPTKKSTPLDVDDQQSISDMCQTAVEMINRQAKVKLNVRNEPKLIAEYVLNVSEKLRHIEMDNEEEENRVIEL
jgi:hypothetical protein